MAIDAAGDLGVFFDPENPWVEVGAYTPPGGGAVVPDVALIRDADQSFIDTGRGSAALERIVFLVRAAQLAAPAEEGRFAIGAKVIEITGPPRHHDKAGLIWRIEGRAVS